MLCLGKVTPELEVQLGLFMLHWGSTSLLLLQTGLYTLFSWLMGLC